MAASVVEEGPAFARVRRVVPAPRSSPPPPPWAAPEQLAKRSYGLSCDVFAWGVIAQQVGAVCDVAVANKEIVERCLLADPSSRPDSDEVMGVCEAQLGVAGKLIEPDEAVWGVGLKEPIPGDVTSEGWQIAPKFKLAHEDLDYGDQVAEGGFSEIYKGTYKGRQVAIKKLKTWLLGDDTLVEFQKEAEVLASLFHPNILVMVRRVDLALCALTLLVRWASPRFPRCAL